VHTQSIFSLKKKSGFKAGALNIVRGDHGGFVNLGKPNERLDLADLLKKYDNIAKSRDIYTNTSRDPYKPVVEYSNDEELIYEKERLVVEKI
jgi:hypothetical protein